MSDASEKMKPSQEKQDEVLKQEQPGLEPEAPIESLGEKKEGPKKGEGKKEKSFFSKEKTIALKESEYDKLVHEAAEFKDKYVRLLAEFDNVRKRTDREKQEFVKYANEGLLAQFLAILDDLERSVEAAKAKHEDYDAFLKGIEMVMAHVYELLKKNNVKPIEAKGKMFDPHLHEALMQEETDQFKEGAIVEEFQKGYFFDNHVIRTAKVKVATAKTAKGIAKDAKEEQPNN
ncbi:MAG TPA: nucleotide exchange factor GrpE [Candidatus Omnitrophota bacterium]|nr:nucleotide exchange factor GrpE [Candidatus Omnitrophota bacterium]HPD84162.1 nucleotide exchange factor GrpE [Candidatus Omnitrophota bacterium]HRZ03019.1 nucleotide exchange factor GrpE [Candidatus Omnitrophota bacterium]